VSRPARATIALLAIAACARTPATPAAKAPVAAPAAKAPAAEPFVPGSAADPSMKVSTDVVFAGDVVYALTRGGRLYAWSGDEQPIRPLALEGVLALAADGSVAATKTKDGEDADRMDVWALPALTRVQSRKFAHGINTVIAVSRLAAYVRINFHNHGYRSDGALMAMPPPLYFDAFWTFASDAVLENRWFPCDPPFVMPGLFMFSADGRRFACTDGGSDVIWRDMASGELASAKLARDWMPPPPPPGWEHEMTAEKKPRGRGTPLYWVLSLRLTPDGNDAYVTYHRDEFQGRGWRFEHWTPGKPGEAGRIERLAATDATTNTRLLAISGDGTLAVLGLWRESLVVRRAPRWEAELLAADGAAAAAVSTDGTRIASGHLDGSLRLWDAATGRLIATAGP